MTKNQKLFSLVVCILIVGFTACRNNVSPNGPAGDQNVKVEEEPTSVEEVVEAAPIDDSEDSIVMGDLTVCLRGADIETAKMIVVLCHGYGAHGKDLVPIAESMSAPEHTCFIMPEAPLELGPNRRAWWNSPDGYQPARAKLIELLNLLTEQNADAKLILGGFSQGAILSSNFLEQDANLISALILFSPSGNLRSELKGSSAQKPFVFLSHGQKDEILPFEGSENLRNKLVKLDYDVEWLPYAGGHNIPILVTIEAAKFIQRVDEAE